MCDSVRLNSLESFSVNLPSISSETWAMYSSAIPGSSVFCDWLFLVFSGVSIETACNFLLFLNVAMILREKLCQLWRLNWFLNFVTKMSISSIMREKDLNKSKQLMISNWVQYRKTRNLCINNSTFVSPIYTIPWRETKLFTRPFKVQKGEKYLNHIIYKGKMPTLAGNKHLSIHFFLHRPSLLPFFDKKKYGPNLSETDIKVVIPAPTQ